MLADQIADVVRHPAQFGFFQVFAALLDTTGDRSRSRPKRAAFGSPLPEPFAQFLDSMTGTRHGIIRASADLTHGLASQLANAQSGMSGHLTGRVGRRLSTCRRLIPLGLTSRRIARV